MRNLKRVLSLVLATLMLLGMMVIGVGAADVEFTDQAELQYPEAVAVMAGIDVIEGIPNADGSLAFTPGKGLTRAEAAVMLCRFLMGRTNADKLSYNTQIFIDVPANHYAAGCIAYCANLGYITGDGQGYFMPDQPLNGSAWAKLLLVAAGYDAQVEKMANVGDAWAQNVATLALANGIDIAGLPLDNPVTREQAVQMLFQLLDVDYVSYKTEVFGGVEQAFPTPITSKDTDNNDDKYLQVGEKYYPDLVNFEGVITANEYADLYGDVHLAEGRTIFDDDGVRYNWSTDLTQIGMSFDVWANGRDVIYWADTGDNAVYETGAATDFRDRLGDFDDDEFEEITGLEAGAAEHYWNFSYGDVEKYEAQIRITYSIDGGMVNVYSIRPDTEILTTDREYEDLYNIFYDEQGYDDAWVVVGTTSKDADENAKNDVSNTMKWREFVAEYLTEDGVELTTEVDVTGNGDWLKVIDNDGDGEADYVFATWFFLDEVTRLSARGALTLACSYTFDGDDEPWVSSADLARGDVVLWTWIDGKAYVELAPSFTGTVDKYTYKTDTLTVEGTDYEESDIYNWTDYREELEDAQKRTDYIYWQDWFGYVRAYGEPDEAAGDLLLLADAYYETSRTQKYYAVNAWMDGEFVDRDAADDEFINTRSDNNNWNKLITYESDGSWNDQDNAGYAETNMARYTVNDDGELVLSDVKVYAYEKDGDIDYIESDYVDLYEQAFTAGEDAFLGWYELDAEDFDKAWADTAAEVNTGEVRVQANNNTVFYYVSWVDADDDPNTPDVKVVTGRKNSLTVLDEHIIRSMYAVATNVTSADNDDEAYWVADAIVIETYYPVNTDVEDDVIFVYEYLNKTVKDYVAAETIKGDGSDAETDVFRVDGLAVVNYNTVNPAVILPAINFYSAYELDEDSGEYYARTIDANYGDYDIYVAEVERQPLLNEYVVAVGGAVLEHNPDDVIVYRLYTRNGFVYASTEDANGNDLELEAGNHYIFFAPRRDIVYAILVTEDPGTPDASHTGETVLEATLEDLYLAIEADALAGGGIYTVNNQGAYSIGDKVPVTNGGWTPGSYVRVESSIENDVYELVSDTNKITVDVTGNMATQEDGWYDYVLDGDTTYVLGTTTTALSTLYTGSATWVEVYVNGTSQGLCEVADAGNTFDVVNDDIVIVSGWYEITAGGGEVLRSGYLYEADGTLTTDDPLVAGSYYAMENTIIVINDGGVRTEYEVIGDQSI